MVGLCFFLLCVYPRGRGGGHDTTFFFFFCLLVSHLEDLWQATFSMTPKPARPSGYTRCTFINAGPNAPSAGKFGQD